MKPKTWKIKKTDPQIRELAGRHNLDPIVVQLLINRGLSEGDFDYFLRSSRLDFHDASLLPDIEKAKQRVKKAVSGREKVLVFGDYDVDGITSLA
ncbi:MAG: single-stranded-DNA-specific exonuclease RecJ, partial [Candidatus Omnitrophica bacterium]|nr:single-stranded-DNA-specific exonuclease RecJ [Candidatus Omnitrophota bacterium]